jgi:hypothetical protein
MSRKTIANLTMFLQFFPSKIFKLDVMNQEREFDPEPRLGYPLQECQAS